MLNRREWLRSNGFEWDPFGQESFQAETDPWLNSLDFSAFWDWENINSLIGNFDFPGYRFIFSSTGGGKTSIRKRIHFQYNKLHFPDSKSNALIVDYLDHTYPNNKISVIDHTKRIIHIIETTLGTSLRQEKGLARSSPYRSVKKMIRTIQEKFGYSGIFVLVDNLDFHSLYKIKSLASTARLFDLKGFVIKFFIPRELFYLCQSELPLSKAPFCLLEWKEKDLLSALKQRLVACLHPDLSANQIMQPISLLTKNDLSNSLINNFVKLGELANNPRIMWQFGNYLIEEHLAISKVGFQTTEPIGHDAISRAYLTLLDNLQKSKMTLSVGESFPDPRPISQLKTRSESKSQPRLLIFVCCEKRYEEAVYDDLYFKLSSKNYLPWMIKYDILPGGNREIEIQNAIKNAAAFVFCLSSKSMEEYGEFQEAVKWARKKQNKMPPNRVFIIPLRLEDCELPEEVTDLKSVDWFLEDQRISLFYALDKIKKITKGELIP